MASLNRGTGTFFSPQFLGVLPGKYMVYAIWCIVIRNPTNGARQLHPNLGILSAGKE